MRNDPLRQTGTPDEPSPRWWVVPWPGAGLAIIAVVVMVVATVVAWPDMAEQIVTREANGRHGTSVVSREVSATLLPLTLVLLVVLLSIAPRLDYLLLRSTPMGKDRSPERARRVFSWTLAGLSVVLTVLHLGVLSMHTGAQFPLEKAMGVACGVLLVAIGIALPMAAPGGRFRTARVEQFRAAQGPAYRYGGGAMVAVGIATSATALVSPTVAVTVATVGIFVVLAGVLGTAVLRGLFRSPE